MSGEVWGFVSAVALILVGILLNQTGLHRLNDRIDRVQSDLGGRLDRMQSDLGARLDRMQADLAQF